MRHLLDNANNLSIMRFYLFVLLLVSLQATAQPSATIPYDTATINFMRWKLSTTKSITIIRRLYNKPIYWPVAYINGSSGLFPDDSSIMACGYGSDTSRFFKYRLFILHSADTTNYSPVQLAGFQEKWRRLFCPAMFASDDLQQIEATYHRRVVARWPAFPGIHRTRRRTRQQSYCAFTLPMFSANYNRAVIWQYRFWVTGESGTLLSYRRTAKGGWKEECQLQFWGHDE